MRDKDDRIESSMPVQSRVDLISLAELAIYWRKQGHVIETMSRLVAWSVDFLVQILESYNEIDHKIESLEEAHELLESRGLIQNSMRRRSKRKLQFARGLENIRREGGSVGKGLLQYDELHRPNAVNPSPRMKISDKQFEEEMGMSRKEARKMFNKTSTIDIESLKSSEPDNSPLWKPEDNNPTSAQHLSEETLAENIKKMKEEDDKLKDF